MFSCFLKTKKSKNISKTENNTSQLSPSNKGDNILNSYLHEVSKLTPETSSISSLSQSEDLQYQTLKTENEILNFTNTKSIQTLQFLSDIINEFKTILLPSLDNSNLNNKTASSVSSHNSSNINDTTNNIIPKIESFLKNEKSNLDAQIAITSTDNLLIRSQIQDKQTQLDTLDDLMLIQNEIFILEYAIQEKESILKELQNQINSFLSKKALHLLEEIVYMNHKVENENKSKNPNEYKDSIWRLILENIEQSKSMYQKMYKQTHEQTLECNKYIASIKQIKNEIDKINNPIKENNVDVHNTQLKKEEQQQNVSCNKSKSKEMSQHKDNVKDLMNEIDYVKKTNNNIENTISSLYKELSQYITTSIELENQINNLKKE